MKDNHKITIRLSKLEREKIKEEAESLCMSVNQYIMHKLSSDDNTDAPKFFFKNFPLLARILISGYMHTRVLGLKHLTTEELERVYKDSEEEFRKLGIEKTDGCIS